MVNNQNGNVLFLILIAVALFAALSYAVTLSSRSGSAQTDAEQEKLDQAVVDNYMAAMEAGRITLTVARGCSTINYNPPSTWGSENKNCHMFHPDGAGVAYQDLNIDNCAIQEGRDKTELAIGEECGGLIYAGSSSGTRLYTTPSDQSSARWSNGNTVTGATSASDGLANTNLLLSLSDGGAPYYALQSCRALGQSWYLPSINELKVLRTNKNLIGNFDQSSGPESTYMTSTEVSDAAYHYIKFNNVTEGSISKSSSRSIRCVRKD